MTVILWTVVLGLVAGSVGNAVIYRVPLSMSWWNGKSMCPKCKHGLGWKDLVPIFSYLSLGGKCRYCHSPIAIRYLLVELFLALSFVVINGHSWSFSSLILSAILWVTVVIAAMDIETMLVSDWLVGSWLVLTLFTMNYELITMNLLGAAVAVGLIGGLWLATKKMGMGEGDIGIAAVMGWWLGWPRIAPAMWVAFVAGAAFGIWQLAIGRKKLKSEIAFGPFLILGTWVGYIWGEKIIGLVFR